MLPGRVALLARPLTSSRSEDSKETLAPSRARSGSGCGEDSLFTGDGDGDGGGVGWIFSGDGADVFGRVVVSGGDRGASARSRIPAVVLGILLSVLGVARESSKTATMTARA